MYIEYWMKAFIADRIEENEYPCKCKNIRRWIGRLERAF